jgi:hypothetical protein
MTARQVMSMFGRALRAGLLGKARALFHGLGPKGEHPSRIEFRPDSRGKFDELFVRFANGSAFFEDLGENGLFVDIAFDDRREGVRLWAGAKRGCLTYSHETDD